MGRVHHEQNISDCAAADRITRDHAQRCCFGTVFSPSPHIYAYMCMHDENRIHKHSKFPLNQGLSTCNNNNNKVMQVHGHWLHRRKTSSAMYSHNGVHGSLLLLHEPFFLLPPRSYWNSLQGSAPLGCPTLLQAEEKEKHPTYRWWPVPRPAVCVMLWVSLGHPHGALSPRAGLGGCCNLAQSRNLIRRGDEQYLLGETPKRKDLRSKLAECRGGNSTKHHFLVKK